METRDGIRLLNELLRLTKANVLKWRKAKRRGLDAFEANTEEITFVVEFIYFARSDEVGSDRTMVRVSLPGLAFDYCIGTEGFDLTCLMLSWNDKGWAEFRNRTRASCQTILRRLRFVGRQTRRSSKLRMH